jgi:hypothetical protein
MSTNIIDNNRPPGGYPKVPALTDIYAEAQKSAQDQRAGGFLGQVILPGEMGFEDFSNTYKISKKITRTAISVKCNHH